MGFANAELDRFIDAYETTLDRSERVQQIAQMERIASEEVPGIPLFWRTKLVAHTSALKGVQPTLAPEGLNRAHKIWAWEWQS
jgi:ABC-type transport system substrate-binding protein